MARVTPLLSGLCPRTPQPTLLSCAPVRCSCPGVELRPRALVQTPLCRRSASQASPSRPGRAQPGRGTRASSSGLRPPAAGGGGGQDKVTAAAPCSGPSVLCRCPGPSSRRPPSSPLVRCMGKPRLLAQDHVAGSGRAEPAKPGTGRLQLRPREGTCWSRRPSKWSWGHRQERPLGCHGPRLTGGPALGGRRVALPQRAKDPPATLWTLTVDLPDPVWGPHPCPAGRGLGGQLSEPPACEE